jgi:hypothetical protein
MTARRRHPVSLSERIGHLERELVACQAENARLREKVAFFEDHPCLAAGIKGETVIAHMLNLARTAGNASYDLEGRVRIEVKYARLTDNGAGVRRWTWGAVFGIGRSKHYDRLILLGDKDPAFSDLYRDASSPYILFDVPFDEVMALTTDGGTCKEMIRLCSNPRAAQSRSRFLYTQYQVTQAELERSYRL